MKLSIKLATESELSEIAKLLKTSKLPAIDICESLVQMFIGLDNGTIAGAIGLEKYDKIGFLRSLAVNEQYKNKRVGEKLIKYLFQFCTENEVEELYLLTTTAEKYFLRFGFIITDRQNAPEAVSNNHEFKEVCPSSAFLMYRKLC